VIVSLEVEDGGKSTPRPTLIKEIQHDPIRGDVMHLDFHQISLTERIRARLAVVTVGSSPGVAEGGILEHTLRELDVACRAMDLPEEARVDISELGLGESIHVADIDLGEKVEILNDPDLSVVSVTVPRVAAKVEEAVVEAVVEPEVIGEKEEAEEKGESPKEEK
jgi:large subunit ribosomal protein L25